MLPSNELSHDTVSLHISDTHLSDIVRIDHDYSATTFICPSRGSVFHNT